MANFNYRQLEDWMELVREYPDAINCFWPSQIKSKRWLVEQVEYQQMLKVIEKLAKHH